MTFLLELKEKFLQFYEEHRKLVNFLFKFAFALLFLILLTNEIGYMDILRNPFIIFLAAILCAFTPGFVTSLVLSSFWVLHSFTVSTQLSVVIILLLAIMYLIFFRFCPKGIYVLLLTVFCCLIHIPFAIPIVLALACSYNYIFAMNFGIIIHFIISTISTYLTGLTVDMSSDNAKALFYITESFFANPNLLTTLIILSATFILVNIIRHLPTAYAWLYAIVIGIVAQYVLIIFVGINLGANLSIYGVVIGTIVGAVSSFLFNFLKINMEYTKEEHLQFEDEDYYYYVKAVPKRNVTVSNVKVTHINVKDLKEADIVHMETNDADKND